MTVDWRFVVVAARARLGMTQCEAASMLGVTQHYISMLENGRREPSVALLVSLADACDVRLSVLIAEAEA